MALQNTAFVLLITFVMANTAASVRDFPIATKPGLDLANTASSVRGFPIATKPGLDLATRLHGSKNDTTDCWSALSELRSCSNEVIAFFLNGYTDIDTPCCNAIEVITHHCWPSILGVLGFTAEEGNLLAGYCDKSSGPVGAPPVSARNHF